MFRPNPGHCPRDAQGKRIRVILANGRPAKGDWAADGKTGCRWTKTGSPFDIAEYEVV